MERRTILKLAAAGILPGASGLVQLGCESGDYRPEFFSTAEIDLLDALSETILPADDHSPGARAAKVARYIDIMVAPPSTLQRLGSPSQPLSETPSKIGTKRLAGSAPRSAGTAARAARASRVVRVGMVRQRRLEVSV